ncbi:MAG: PQQ-binding-like beta-propeller repeat protein [Candidatus Micrarchaeota archaeon]|nr:PQQ-binding-like beta-propeller repeat protein [Candidatus Micrarchaeota archaeon]
MEGLPMKLVIFTLDSIFALIIAVSGIALLSYFFYLPQTSTILSYSSAASTLQTLLSTGTFDTAFSSALASNLTYQANASTEVWDQYRADAYHTGSNVHGPLSPSISFLFNAGATPTNMTIDYGKVFFGAGNTLYAINATNGNMVWKKTTGSTIYGDPAIASGMLIYPNATNLTAVNPSTNALIWSSSGAASMGYLTPYSSPLLIYNNKIYFGGKIGAQATDLAYYLNNGTNAWKYTVPSGGYSLAVISGSIGIIHAGNLFNLMEDFGSSANAIWSASLAPTLGFSVVPGTNIVALQGSTQANAMYVDGTQVSGFPYSIINTATQPAIYNNIIYYQTSNAVTAVASNGVQLWSSIPSTVVGTSSSWGIVVVSAKTVYTEWSNNYIVAMNTSTGSIIWYTKVPTQLGSLAFGDMALAYGRLYAVVGSNVISFGTCNLQSSKSLVSFASSLYLNGGGSCADALVNSIAPMTNYSIFLNNTFAPGRSVATFTGTNSYTLNPTKAVLNNLQTFTISGWINPSSCSSSPEIYTEGVPQVTLAFELTPSCNLYIATWNINTVPGNWQSFTSSLTIPLNKWSFVAGVLTVGGVKGTYQLYLNNNLQSSAGQPEINSGATYSGIGYSVGSIGGQANDYFSGSIANLQIYNSSLSPLQISKIYASGLQGPPLSNSGLVAWYPLAGDSNDYSGLGNTQYPTNVVYKPGNYLPSGYLNSYQVSSSGVAMPITNYTTGITKLYKVNVVSWR